MTPSRSLGWEDDAMRLTDLTRKYLADPRYLASERSKETYDLGINQFLGYLQTISAPNSVDSFTADNVEGFVQWLYSEKKLSNTTVNLRLSALSGLAAYAMQNKDEKTRKPYMDKNPVDFIKRPRNETPKQKFLAMNEIKKILDVDAQPNEKLALALLFRTNLRATAAAEAKVKNLTLDGERVLLTVTEKGDVQRTVTLPPDLADELVASLKQREAGPEETLLLNTEGKPYTRQTISNMVARLAVRAGITRIRVGSHLFNRHSPASIVGEDGASEFQIASMLGHRTTATAKKYTHGVTADKARSRVWDLLNEGEK